MSPTAQLINSLRTGAWEFSKAAVLFARAKQQLGIIGAVQLILAKVKRSGIIELKINGLPGRFSLRSGTSDVLAVENVLVHREYEEPHLILTTPVIVDAGANIGCASVYFANRFPEARVYAIEPDLGNIALLQRNISSYKNIELIHGAVWPTHSQLAIRNARSEAWSYQVSEQTDNLVAETVPALTMDDILRMVGGQRIGLLKLDIEGSELELFATDDLAWLERVDALAIEFHDRFRPGSARAFYRAISDWDFTQFTIGENVFVYRHR